MILTILSGYEKVQNKHICTTDLHYIQNKWAQLVKFFFIFQSIFWRSVFGARLGSLPAIQDGNIQPFEVILSAQHKPGCVKQALSNKDSTEVAVI